ncbi:MAG: BtrH N-terminal domain-containing protein [Crocinitomicaceae bacterium]|nr:BtrH N-terminal domain-containing protein [Crocinitomicaceae bacterium]
MENFKHIQTAHCENGVTVNLLQQQGLDFMTEPLAFGIGSGLFYIHIPFLKVNGGPAISFRSMPGAIFKRTCKVLNVPVVHKKFKTPEAAQLFLDQKVDQGISVGCQVGVFHLMYFPKEYRFHFNAHNLIVFGKDGDDYLVSDPVMETTTSLTKAELEKVRFSKGPMAPKGHIYYPEKAGIVTDEMLRKGIVKGINRNVRDMLRIPTKIAGVRGINHTASKVRKWRDQYGERTGGLFLGQIVRMQEEIGTGGGGFRFLYAAFLEQASEKLGNDKLIGFSEQFTKSGDLWRDSALQMAGIYKGRITAQKDFDDCADIMNEISALEKKAFQDLSKIKL